MSHTDRKSAPRGSSGNHQEWVPRGSSAPLLPTPVPDPKPDPKSANLNPYSHHRPHHHHRPNPNRNPNRPAYFHRPAPPPAEPVAARSLLSEIPQLVQEIQGKLSRGAVECMICYEMVKRSSPIWSCSNCFSIFHLHCIRKWSRSPTSSADASSSSSTASWRCPGCQSVQSTSSSELIYTCFCGRHRDPSNDFYLTPHSCGEPCGKPLDRRGGWAHHQPHDPDSAAYRCLHVCVLQCHPGPCPPCKAFAPRQPCPCGKKTIVRRCSDRTMPLTCGQRCDRLLSCRRHRCEKLCHTGACSPCRVPVLASCFCGKRTEVVLCGDMAFKGEVDGSEGEGIFSCNSQCGRVLACRNHRCGENCHAGPCGECELIPEKIRRCCCGKTELKEERKSCLDPIPTCYNVCEKMLQCGLHRCSEKCHEGECVKCLVKVEQKCWCGSSHRTVECYRSTEERDSFVCEKTCGRKKNCGRHRCSERCCPLSKPGSRQLDGDWDPHLCSVPCGKKLRCGQHSCQLLCHSGHCPPCLETIFTDLTCACGKTSIPPPLPCGTPYPSCPHPCLIPQPCDHSASHTCHFGDCPLCSVPIAKECIGSHVLLRNIPCGSKDIRCNQLCGKTRQCGMHACTRTCHPPPCDPPPASGSASGARSSCGQICGTPRRDCKHTCTASCHPLSPCPDLRCEFPVTIACSCGRITATVSCGVGGSTSGFNVDSVLEASIIQKLPAPLQPVEGNAKKIPLEQRKMTCDEECEKLARKKQLAEAFNITTPNLDSLLATDLIADIFRREPKWILAVEERFKYLVLGRGKGTTSTGLRVHVFCPALKEKRDAIRHIAERWKLTVHAAGWEPKRFLVVHVTRKSKPPARILGSKPGVPVTALHPPAFDPLIDVDPRLVVAMLDLPRDADISALVLRFGGECELVWLNDKNALAVFSDPARAATALRRLDHCSVYQGAVVVLQNGGALGGNVWGGGGAKEGGAAAAAVKSGNPWKKALAPESDSWGGDWHAGAGADAAVPVWKGNEAAPIAISGNRWNVLDTDAATNLVLSESVEGGDSAALVDGRLVVQSGGGVSATSLRVPDGKVDDWEEACE